MVDLTLGPSLTRALEGHGDNVHSLVDGELEHAVLEGEELPGLGPDALGEDEDVGLTVVEDLGAVGHHGTHGAGLGAPPALLGGEVDRNVAGEPHRPAAKGNLEQGGLGNVLGLPGPDAGADKEGVRVRKMVAHKDAVLGLLGDQRLALKGPQQVPADHKGHGAAENLHLRIEGRIERKQV
jgi:hypothetical protein